MFSKKLPIIHGRGADDNPQTRFDPMHVVYEPDEDTAAEVSVPTLFFRDKSRSILAENDSPDVGFRYSLNPYRGCEHGCIYCYARPSHEYLSFGAGLDFETRIMIKEDAPALLRKKFMSREWRGEPVALSGNTDCYQPVERKLEITRRCLEVFAEFRNPVGIITKSALVKRDVDVLRELARHSAVVVHISLTSLDLHLSGVLEPRAARPARRLEAMRALADAGVAVGVNVAPVIPGLNDTEIPALLEAAHAAGATSAHWVLLRLPKPVDGLFEAWLERHFSQRKDKVLSLIRQCREGRLNDAAFGRRMRGQGSYAQQLDALFRAGAHKAGFGDDRGVLSSAAFRRPVPEVKQLALF